jgi:DNA-binding CsgD family transcriptional regulator
VPRLNDAMVGAILRFLREAYVQPDPDAFARHAVERLPEVVGAQRVSYNEMHPRRGVVRAVVAPACARPLLTVRHYEEHPMMQRFLRSGDGRAAAFSDFLTPAALHATAMYQEHYRLVGVEHQVAVFLGRPGVTMIGFALGRDRLDFADRDRLALDLLRPHLARAHAQAAGAARLRERVALLGRAAEAAAGGLVLLDADGRIAFATRRARQALRDHFGARGRPSSRLPAEVVDWLRHHEGWGADPGDVAAPPAPLVSVRDDRRLTIRVAADGSRRALLVEETCLTPDAAALLALGLTRREAEVLALVATGAATEGIAHALGTRPRTVAKHVERIHRKLGVTSRGAASARAHAVWRGAPP